MTHTPDEHLRRAEIVESLHDCSGQGTVHDLRRAWIAADRGKGPLPSIDHTGLETLLLDLTSPREDDLSVDVYVVRTGAVLDRLGLGMRASVADVRGVVQAVIAHGPGVTLIVTRLLIPGMEPEFGEDEEGEADYAHYAFEKARGDLLGFVLA